MFADAFDLVRRELIRPTGQVNKAVCDRPSLHSRRARCVETSRRTADLVYPTFARLSLRLQRRA